MLLILLQVCQERNCQEEVFLLALNYMDRFLATTLVRKTNLQTLAAACLLMASKLREPSSRGLPADSLVFYTDNSVSKCELIVSTNLLYILLCVCELDYEYIKGTRDTTRQRKTRSVSGNKNSKPTTTTTTQRLQR